MTLQDAIDTMRDFAGAADAGTLSEGDLIYAHEAAGEIEAALTGLRAAIDRATAPVS